MNKLVTARGVQITLAVLWIIDGLFQLQQQMFTKNFALQVIAPAVDGQPAFISGPVNFAVQTILQNPVLWGVLFAVIQLAIGVLILVKPTVKLGLITSIIWGVAVWLIGESAGGIFGGHTSLLTGAPGAAILYSILSLAVYPRKSKEVERKHQPAFWLLFVWAAIWIGGAIYQLLPGQNTLHDISTMLLANADGAPMWLVTIDMNVASFITSLGTAVAPMTTNMHMSMTEMAQMQTVPNTGYWFILLASFVQFIIGILVFTPRYIRQTVISIGILVSVIFWVIGQSMGEYYSGLATDPATAPLIILLGIAVLGNTKIDKIIGRFYIRLSLLLKAIGHDLVAKDESE